MAVAIATIGSSASATITKPASLAEGDLMIALVGGVSTDGFTRSGWTQLVNLTGTLVDSGADPAGRFTCLAKVASAADAAETNFAFTGATANAMGAILRITRTVGSTTWPSAAITTLIVTDNDLITGGTPGVGGTFTFTGGVTPVNTNSLLVYSVFGGSYDSAGSSGYAVANNNPAWSEQFDTVGPFVNNNKMGLICASATFSPASATGNYSHVGAFNAAHDNAFGVLISISETIDASVAGTTGVINLVGNEGTVAAGANVTGGSPAVINIVGNEGTVSAGTAKWKNTAKSSAGAITNTPKS